MSNLCCQFKNTSPLDHVHSKHLSQTVCSESVCFEPENVRNFPKVLRIDGKTSNDGDPSFKGHESFIDLLDIPETSGKRKLQTSSNIINTLAEPIDELIDKLVEGEETVLPIITWQIFYVSHTKLSELFDKPRYKSNDRVVLRDFHQKVKCINNWLKSVGYLQTFSPTQYIVKTVKRLLNHLRESLYKSNSNITVDRNSFVSLEQFKKWLGTKVKEQFNHIANILSIDQWYRPRDPIGSNNINQDESQEIKCCLCSDDHKLSSCDQFLSQSLYEKKAVCWKGKIMLELFV